jgi:GrpB-like predicted nucleotidyltransferase (UPF0157 family)
MSQRVEIVAYDPAWPLRFLEIAETVRNLLPDSVLAIHHIGSTAIPALAAKPLIDVDIVLPTAQDVLAACPIMEAAGYEPRGNRYDADMFAFMKRSETPGQRLYLGPEGHDTHRRRMLFRDHLRANPQTAADYQALKRDLAEKFEYDGDGYTAAKAAFVNAVIEQAQCVQR